MPKRIKQLEWSTSALDELDEGVAFYAERNPVVAQRMLEEIERASQSLVAATIPVKGNTGISVGLTYTIHPDFSRSCKWGNNDSNQILRVMHTARKYP